MMGKRIMIIPRNFFVGMFGEGERHYNITHGLPIDAKLIAISLQMQFDYDRIALKFESAEWAEVPEGARIPEFEVTITTIEPEKDLVKLPTNGVKFREFT